MIWTTELAERRLPIEGLTPSKYECQDGRLVLTPCGDVPSSLAKTVLARILRLPVQQAGMALYARTNMRLTDRRWIEPDLTLLWRCVKNVIWVPADRVVMPIEVESRFSRGKDWIDRPGMCAAAGVPYFMRVEVDDGAQVELLRLDDSGEYVVQAKALAGQEFRTDLPFSLSFDPAELLEH